MARIRSVHPGLASDEAFMSMSMAAKAAWALLWTECDDHGVFEWKPIVLKARIFPADTVDFNALLNEYVELGCVQKVEHEARAYGLVRNFCKYQRPKSPSYKFHVEPEWLEYVSFKANDSTITSEQLPQAYPRKVEKAAQREDEGGRVELKKEKETAVVAVSLPTAADFENEELERRAEQATGWRDIPCFGIIIELVKAGFDFEGRILPLMREEARKRKGLNHGAPETWAYFAKMVRDGNRKPKASRIDDPKVFVRKGSEQFSAWESYRGKSIPGRFDRDLKIEGWDFPSEWPPKAVDVNHAH